jgi:hypothetical protein
MQIPKVYLYLHASTLEFNTRTTKITYEIFLNINSMKTLVCKDYHYLPKTYIGAMYPYRRSIVRDTTTETSWYMNIQHIV